MFDAKKSFFKFLTVKFLELSKLVQSLKYFSFFSPVFRYWIGNWTIYTFFYPLARLTKNKEKSVLLCERWLKMPSGPGVFSWPRLTKNKLILKEKIDWDIFIEIYLRDVYCQSIILEEMKIIDVGAHIGLYATLAASKTGPSGKVIAIEPSTKNYKNLIENIKINNYNNIIPVKKALSDHEGLENLYLSSSSVRHSLDYNTAAKMGFISPVKVEVATLDKLLENLSLKKIDIIKIDAEGEEMKILKGSEKTLKNNPTAKILVASYHYPKETKEVRDYLGTLGFKTKVSLPDIVTTF